MWVSTKDVALTTITAWQNQEACDGRARRKRQIKVLRRVLSVGAFGLGTGRAQAGMWAHGERQHSFLNFQVLFSFSSLIDVGTEPETSQITYQPICKHTMRLPAYRMC
ncbi:hypothetical protein AOLI_G00053840 [Acnodon oligacanthus]